MLSVEQVQDQILEQLKSTGIQIWEETVPAGVKLKTQNNRHLPYVLISFGGQSPVAMWQQGITSSAQDLKWTSVGTECVGETPRDRRAISAIVRKTLEGYIPDAGWGQLREQLSDSYTVKVPEFALWPVRYATGIVFNTQVNAIIDAD